MSLSRREFLQVLAAASASGLALDAGAQGASPADARFYDLPKFGDVRLLHFTDCHAQLLPSYFREPSVNLGIGDGLNRPPNLVGEHLLREFGIRPGTRNAHAFTHLDFSRAARRYGKIGGFAHLSTLVKKLRADGPPSLLLDGGDSWQGSATSLWTQGRDMIEASTLLGVEAMTAHWEFTYGAARVQQAVEKELKGGDLGGPIEFLAQNVKTTDFNDPVFKPYVIRELGGVPVAIIGQAFPYTPIANPRHLIPEWSFGIDEDRLQQRVDEARAGKGDKAGAQVVVLLSHNGMSVDLKLASRVTGIDAILGGHTHDGVPAPTLVSNAGGKTLVTNAGSNGKFLAVLDLEVRDGRVADFRYRLLPVFANLIPADEEMRTLIEKVRDPFKEKLAERLAVSEGLLYRRGNFNGTFDQVILDAMMAEKNAEIAFSPGFRWGTTLLPGDAITFEHLMDQTAITYPSTTLNTMSGESIKTILEDVCDNFVNPDPYYRQGGDMVRVGGLAYSCDPTAKMGARILDMRLRGKPLEAAKMYKVAGWAPVAEGATGEPIWDLVGRYLRGRKIIKPPRLNQPVLKGVTGNRGMV
ncbi:MAG: thiosulfohydrolase SoxB [Betaproteobacteria bacterium RIFCSPLOWO2_02_FULL_62_17]|nr:MAG: thiosulfohydrolase SoxB [Betaproteobacteria bacterium RIFCSPLOWO2_02_FULL_62_17]